MIDITYALIPVFAVIMVGFILRASELIAKDEWSAINHLCYYVLMPMLIIKSLSTADLSAAPVFRIAAAMVVAIFVMSALLLLARVPLLKLLDLSDAAYTSLFQGATRWHGFIALAIIAALYGDKGIIVGSIGLAIMVPLLNIINVIILSLYGDRDTTHRPSLMGILSKNPFIIGCAIGIAFNFLPFQLPGPVLATFDLIGRAALSISLMTVGAALNPALVFNKLPAVLSTAVLRLLLMPALMLAACMLFGVTGDSLVIAVICAAVPTAASGFILAGKMGGDAELMASIITFQVLVAIGTLPLIISSTMSLVQ
jgi:malonate transporter and related proteins